MKEYVNNEVVRIWIWVGVSFKGVWVEYWVWHYEFLYDGQKLWLHGLKFKV